jgi:uncharacterized coiled-coil protein SlyX
VFERNLMSVGNWFTLNPLDFVTRVDYNQDITEITSTLTTLEGTVGEQGNNIDNLTTQLTSLTTQVNNLTIQVNDMSTQLNNLINSVIPSINSSLNSINANLLNLAIRVGTIEAELRPYSNFDYSSVEFSNGIGSTFGNFYGSWYRLHKFEEGGGDNFKYMLFIARGFDVNFGIDELRHWSQQFEYPFEVSNDYRQAHVYDGNHLRDGTYMSLTGIDWDKIS